MATNLNCNEKTSQQAILRGNYKKPSSFKTGQKYYVKKQDNEYPFCFGEFNCESIDGNGNCNYTKIRKKVGERSTSVQEVIQPGTFTLKDDVYSRSCFPFGCSANTSLIDYSVTRENQYAGSRRKRKYRKSTRKKNKNRK
jgi:hypothetical protein